MMIFSIFIGVLAIYFAPLFVFCLSVISSKNFQLKSELVRVLVGMSEQVGRIRDVIATICVPILALFSIKLDKTAAFDYQTLSLAFVFLGTALVSLVSYGICRASTERLADYGPDYPQTLLSLLENYSRETLIYFSVMLGVSAGPLVSK
jgi:hypothetical protein